MYCFKCGKTSRPDAKFCGGCGNDLEEQQKAYLLEQERIALELKKQEELHAEARRKQFEQWRDRIWGDRGKKIRTMAVGGTVLVIIALIAGGILIQRVAEQRKVARTTLMIQAIDRDDWVQVRELVEKGVDVNATDNAGQTPLFRAIIKSNTEDKVELDTITSLIEHGADVNAYDNRRRSLLHSANNPAVSSLLLSRGAAVDAKDIDGITPLHGCLLPEKVKQLIESHADVNVQMNSGDTPLHGAASCGSLLNVKALVEHGAQVNVTNQQGKTPLDKSLGYPEIGAYLKTHGATGEIPVQAQVSNVEQDTPGRASSSVPPTTAIGGFESYAVPVYSGSIVSPNFRSAPKSYSMFRTVISQGARQGVNFAGHHTVIVVGCGTGCRSVFLVDAKSGKIFGFPLGGEENYMLALDYRADSSLIKAHWQVDVGDLPVCVGQEFVLLGTSFKLFHEERQPGRCTSTQ